MTPTFTILIVLTSHATLGATGRPTGFYLSEVAHPWRVFREAGCRVDLVSPAGGRPPMDGEDLSDPIQSEFLRDPEMSAKLDHTPAPDRIDPAHYDAIFFAGGHGTMWDFRDNAELVRLAAEVYERGGVVAAVCHGPAALVNVTLSDGSALVADRAVTAFTNAEEAAAGLTDVVPFALQTALELRGARYSGSANFTAHVVADGRLVTGQNPASATGTAEAVLGALRASSPDDPSALVSEVS
ncbi:MAG: type 1 glutamine amidotransferase domain-containing protein [Pseudonocardia sp.]